MKTSVVAISYNSAAFLPGLLDSLLAQTKGFGEIIIVDNNSGDASVRIIKDYADLHPGAGIRPLLLNENTGYAAAANMGAHASSGDIVMVTNADILLSPTVNEKILEKFGADRDLAMLSPLILRFDGITADSAGQTWSRALHPVEIGFNQRLTRLTLKERQVFSVCGAASVFRRSALEVLEMDGQYYDEDFFIFWEDFDLGWRATQMGLKIMFFPDIMVRHFRSATLERNFWSRFSLALARPPFIKYHLVKNRYLTLIKNFRWRRFYWTLPFIFLRDIVWVGLLTFVSPKIIIPLMKSFKYCRRAYGKRKELMRRERRRRDGAGPDQ